MFIVMLLFSGIDMIGDMPSRVIPTEEPVIEETVEVTIPELPAPEKSKKPKRRVLKKKPVEPECAPPLPAPEAKPDTESDTKVEDEPEPMTEERMIPFPEVDELEPGEKEVEALDTSEDGYKYYVYRSHNCAPCIWLVDELQKNVDEKDLILSYERTTKSGKYVTYVPVLEVYKDGKLVHQQTGYTSWKTIQRKISEAD